jgi:hypothetical protein
VAVTAAEADPGSQKSNAAEHQPTQKQALAEALGHLGPNASHAALAQFVKHQFGMKLTFGIVVEV